MYKPVIQAMKHAVQLCADVQKKAGFGGEKAPKDPVTVADYGSQAILNRAIDAHFPQDAIMAEERGQQFLTILNEEQQTRTLKRLQDILGIDVTKEDVVSWMDLGRETKATTHWAVDPIDGTRGFVKGLRYCVAVAHIESTQPTWGALACPEYPSEDGNGFLFVADQEGVYRTSLAETTTEKQPLQLAPAPKLSDARVVLSRNLQDFPRALIDQCLDAAGIPESSITYIDGQGKYASVACGDANIFLRFPKTADFQGHYIWDHAPGVALVRKAGGVISDITGGEVMFGEGNILNGNLGVIACHPDLHEQVLKITKQVISTSPSLQPLLERFGR